MTATIRYSVLRELGKGRRLITLPFGEQVRRPLGIADAKRQCPENIRGQEEKAVRAHRFLDALCHHLPLIIRHGGPSSFYDSAATLIRDSRTGRSKAGTLWRDGWRLEAAQLSHLHQLPAFAAEAGPPTSSSAASATESWSLEISFGP